MLTDEIHEKLLKIQIDISYKTRKRVSLEKYENNVVVYKELEDVLNEVVEKHKASLEIIKRRKRLDRQFPKERRALVEFARIVKANKLSCKLAAKLINKDRTMIYHYSNETKV